MGRWALDFLAAGTDLAGAAGFDGSKGVIRKWVNSPAIATSNTRIDQPVKTFVRELWNSLLLRDFLRVFFLRVVIRFAMYAQIYRLFAVSCPFYHGRIRMLNRSYFLWYLQLGAFTISIKLLGYDPLQAWTTGYNIDWAIIYATRPVPTAPIFCVLRRRWSEIPGLCMGTPANWNSNPVALRFRHISSQKITQLR